MGPHDALFKHTFADPANAAGEVRSVLPQTLVAAIDWQSLELCPGSFVDAELSEHHVDLLYRVLVHGQEALVYLLLEHKSHDDGLLPLHLLRYMVRTWSWRERSGGTTGLAPIVPIVVSHGRTPNVDIERCFALEGLPSDVAAALRPFVPRFRILLDDLSVLPPEAILQRLLPAMGKLSLLCLQRFRESRDLEADLTLVAGLMRDVLASGQPAETLHAVMRYILLMTDRPAATLGNLLRGIAGPTAEEAMVSTGERMMREAARQAYERGTTEGQRALLLRLIVRRFGPQPAELVAKVEAGSPADLERWAERVLEAATIDDLFA